MEDNELLKLVHQGQQLYLQAHDKLAYILEPIVSAIKSKKKLCSNPKFDNKTKSNPRYANVVLFETHIIKEWLKPKEAP